MMCEPFLNRWRGTGGIFFPFGYKITGTMLYALYIGLLFGFLTTWYIGLISLALFLLGESMGWGKWVGALCYPETKLDLQKEYDDLEGYNFPFIHQVSNAIIKEKKNFFGYCNIALGIRGLYWGVLVYLGLIVGGYIINCFIFLLNILPFIDIPYVINVMYISLIEYIALSLIWAVGFPFACWLSTKKSFNYKSKFISICGKWETQEVYYGIIHMVCNYYIIYTITN